MDYFVLFEVSYLAFLIAKLTAAVLVQAPWRFVAAEVAYLSITSWRFFHSHQLFVAGLGQ